VPNFIILALFVWLESTVRNLNGQNLNFMKIGQTIFLTKKNLKTNYNLWIVNSVPKMNILSLKMDMKFPIQVNREYIRKDIKKGNNSAKNWKFKNLKKTPGGIHKKKLCAKFNKSSFICVVRIEGQKSKWPKFKFHENWQNNFFDQKYSQTNYNS